MTAFDDFLDRANSEAAEIMGEQISIGAQLVLAVFDEQSNEWNMDEYAEESHPTVSVVIPTEKLNDIPEKKTRFKRISTNETFFITEVKISSGNVTLMATNETKRDG